MDSNLEKKIDQQFGELDTRWWEFRKKIELTKDFTPVNLIQEKETFIQMFKNGQVYNPQYIYEEIDYEQYRQLLTYFEKQFLQYHDFILTPFYLKKIQDLKEHFFFFRLRDSSEFLQWLSGLYSQPTAKELEEASLVINRFSWISEVDEKNYNTDDAVMVIRESLMQRNLSDWQIEVTQMVARMAVNSLQRKIKINRESTFSQRQIQRLIVHEVDSHILRSQNGLSQPWGIFAYGFPDYLETEEGIAITNERKQGLLHANDEIRYALRIILASRCVDSSFYELFEFCLPHVNNNYNTAFTMVMRLKRGLTDTSKPGGYLKDLVYFRGFLKVSQATGEQVKALYCGKIGIEHLTLLDELEYNKNYIIPSWL